MRDIAHRLHARMAVMLVVRTADPPHQAPHATPTAKPPPPAAATALPAPTPQAAPPTLPPTPRPPPTPAQTEGAAAPPRSRLPTSRSATRPGRTAPRPSRKGGTLRAALRRRRIAPPPRAAAAQSRRLGRWRLRGGSGAGRFCLRRSWPPRSTRSAPAAASRRVRAAQLCFARSPPSIWPSTFPTRPCSHAHVCHSAHCALPLFTTASRAPRLA